MSVRQAAREFGLSRKTSGGCWRTHDRRSGQHPTSEIPSLANIDLIPAFTAIIGTNFGLVSKSSMRTPSMMA